MLNSYSSFHQAYDSFPFMLMIPQKYQARYWKTLELIKQQTFAFLGVVQALLTKLSACIFSFKAQIFKLKKLCLQAVESTEQV